MKKTILMLAAVAAASAMQAQSLSGILKGLGGKSSSAEKTEQAEEAKSKGSAIGSILGNLLGSDKISPKDIVGTWKYSGPSVEFESENFLQKAGGAAAAAAIEKKLVPYYERARVTSMVLTVNPDSTFVMQMTKGKITGTLSESPRDGFMTFNFTMGKRIKIGKMDASVTKAGPRLTVTFDMSKLMTLVNTVSAVSGSPTISGLNSVLQSYDGLMAGFAYVKQKE